MSTMDRDLWVWAIQVYEDARNKPHAGVLSEEIAWAILGDMGRGSEVEDPLRVAFLAGVAWGQRELPCKKCKQNPQTED